MKLPMARSLQELMAAACIAAVFFSVFYQSNRLFDAANADGSTKTMQINLSTNETEAFLEKVIEHLEDKLARLGEPQPSVPYSLPDVLHCLGAISFPDKIWEVPYAYGEHMYKANVTEAGIEFWANQIREVHVLDFGTHTFAVRCILTFNRENVDAIELLWGWKVALGSGNSDKKSRCWRTSYTMSEMRTLAAMQPANKLTLGFADDISRICASK